MKPKIIILAGFLIITVLLVLFFKENIVHVFFSPRIPNSPKKLNDTANKNIEIIENNLSIPWEMVILPNKEMLVTQRSGELLLINKQTRRISQIKGVKHVGEGGLLGMALDPNFANNHFIYLYLTTDENEDLENRVERYKYQNNKLEKRTIILSGIKGSVFHDGGRIAFGPDKLLYITTGDAQNPDLAQDPKSLNGKILRINPDGSVPIDNPFDNEVYSYGHRNPQGLAWDNNGNFWSSEHGPSGLSTGFDEINLIKKGQNYGWPKIKGEETTRGMVAPVLQSGKEDTWAPSGMIFYKDSLYFAGLRGETLYKAKIDKQSNLSLNRYFVKKFGRLRTVVKGPGDYLYILTNNTDGRGKTHDRDDKIIKINLKLFN